MPRKNVDLLPKFQCDGPGQDAFGHPLEAERCPNMVSQTKPSKSGLHYCRNKVCQNARARQYQRAQAENSRRQVRIWELTFLHDVAHKKRVECSGCGLENALPGWPHRDASALPCQALRAPGDNRRVPVDMIDAVWPRPVHVGSAL